MPQQLGLLAPPAPAKKRRGRILGKVKSFVASSRSPSRAPDIVRRNVVQSDRPIAASTPQSLMVPAHTAARPHTSYSGSSTPKTRDPSPLATRDNVAAVSTGDPSPLTAGGDVAAVSADDPSPLTTGDNVAAVSTDDHPLPLTAGDNMAPVSTGNRGSPSSSHLLYHCQ